MASFCNNNHHLYLFHQIRHSIAASIASRAFSTTLKTTSFRLRSSQSSSTTKPNYSRLFSESASASGTFTWDDVVQISKPVTVSDDDPSDLIGYFEKIKICNRGSVIKEYFPFHFLGSQTCSYSYSCLVCLLLYTHFRKCDSSSSLL